MTFSQCPIYCRVSPCIVQKLQSIPQKFQLEVIFMEKIEPRRTKLARRLNITRAIVDFILEYKNHILQNWKYNPYPDINMTSRQLEDYIVIAELVSLWKETLRRMENPEVTDEAILQQALYLKKILKAHNVVIAGKWLKTFKKISEIQRTKKHKDLSLDFRVLMPKLICMFPDKSYNRYLSILKEAIDDENVGIIPTGNSTASDYDSDVEEIITPVEFVDITEDACTTREEDIKIKPEKTADDEILNTDCTKVIEDHDGNGVIDGNDVSDEKDSDTVVVYQYVETDSDNNDSDIEQQDGRDEAEDEDDCEEDKDTVVVYQYVKINSEDEIDGQSTGEIFEEEFENESNEETETVLLNALSNKNEVFSEDNNKSQENLFREEKEGVQVDIRIEEESQNIDSNISKMFTKRSRKHNLSLLRTKRRRNDEVIVESSANVQKVSQAPTQSQSQITNYKSANKYLMKLKNFALKQKDPQALVCISQLSKLFREYNLK